MTELREGRFSGYEKSSGNKVHKEAVSLSATSAIVATVPNVPLSTFYVPLSMKLPFLLLAIALSAYGAKAAAVQNVQAQQRPKSDIVDIYYDLVTSEGEVFDVSISIEGVGDISVAVPVDANARSRFYRILTMDEE